LTPGEHTSSLTLRLRTFRFPFGCGDQLLNLANEQDSLGHFSKRTTGRCSYHRFHAQSAFSQLVKDSFQLSLTLLVNYRSRAVFRIGSLCLPHSRAISNARYSLSLTWPYEVRLRGFHPLWRAIPGGLSFSVFIRHYSRNLFDFYSSPY